MTTELGSTSLEQARLARGLTIEDAERSTRISRRFLVALEEHDYTAFPAPIYARGFLRTYCRYLGVDPDVQLAELPEGWATSTPTTHLPPVSHGSMTFNPAWIVAGFLIVAVAALGIILGQGGGGEVGPLDAQAGNEALGVQQPTTEAGSAPAAAPTNAVPTPTEDPDGARSLDAGIPGVLPDFTNVAIDDVTDFLRSQDLAYLRIDAASEDTAAGLVVEQDPAPGEETDGLDQVTLTVSAGPAVNEAARTDCNDLEDSNRRTAAEQAYFEDNCVEEEMPDRTSCEEIRGTDYRSASERQFFLANCIIQ